MTDFWGNADGDEKKAFAGGFTIIPEGTEVIAEVNKAVLDESGSFGPYYSLSWKIIDGEYKNRLVFQSIPVFDKDVIKAETAKNLFMFLFKTLQVHVPPNAPTDMDLLPMIGKLALIKIGAWTNKDGKTKNVIREVHAHGDVSRGTIESAFSRNADVAKTLDGDIPF